MIRNCLLVILTAAIAFSTAGCWDRIEIQDRGIVKALAIDLAPPQPSPEERLATFTQPHGGKTFRLSLQVLSLSPKQGTRDKPQSQTYVLFNTGHSIFEMVRDTLGQTSKTLNFEHLDTIVISEAVLREASLRAIIDYFIREPEYRWRIKLYVTSGEALAILKHTPPTSESGGQFIASIANNQMRNAHIPVGRSDLGYTASAIDNGGDVFLPRLELSGEVLKMGGGAVFRKDRFASYVDEYAVQGLRLLRGIQKSASIVAPCPDHPDGVVAMKMISLHTSLKPHADKDGRLYYTVNMKIEGRIEELSCADRHPPLDSKAVPKLETIFRQEFVNNVAYGVAAVKAWPIDPSGYLGGKVRAYLPAVWREVKDDWPQALVAAPFLIDADVTVRNLGEHR